MNQHISGHQYAPNIAALPDGRVLFTYVTADVTAGDSSPNGVSARVGSFDTNGNVVLGEEFLVNEHIQGGQTAPKITSLSDGRVLISFNTQDPAEGDTDGIGISGRILDLGIGSDANDTITGTANSDMLSGMGGNDTLIGASGDDILSGGSGDDLFVFTPGFGHDIINDFQAGVGTEDVIEFNQALFADYAAVLAAAVEVSGDTVITFDASNSLVLKNVLLANLHADDFQFVA